MFDVTRYRRFIQYRAKHQPHPVTDGFWRGAWNRSFTSTAIHKIRKLHRSVKLPGIRITGAVRLPGGQTVNEYFGHPASPLSADELDALREAARTFAAGFQLCSSRGARLLVVFVPEKFRVLQSFCRFPEQSLCRNWVVNDLPGRLRESMKAAAPQIEYLDLTPVLMEAVRRGTIPYENDDSHWNADGERIAAEAVHRYLSANQLID